MHKQLTFTVRGTSPLLMHNGRLADPLDPYAKRIKEYTSKKKKTDEDYRLVADAEWEGSLYTDTGDLGGRLIVPSAVIEGMMTEAAKKTRDGKNFKAALFVEDDAILEYDGPKDLAKLRDDPRFRNVQGIRVGQSRVMRCRPVFNSWGFTFVAHYLPSVLNQKQVQDAVELAGRIVGIGDYRPKYGRFDVV